MRRRSIGQIYRTAVRGGDPIAALTQATLIEQKVVGNWHTSIREQAPVMQATGARTFGRSLTETDKTRMATNVSPSISPDGRSIVFFSSRDLFSIDLYLAETATGRIVKKLVDTAQSSHFTSLQFIGSAGSWSPDSRQFVVAASMPAGRARHLDIADGDVVRNRSAGSWRDPQPDVVARRQGDRLFGNRRGDQISSSGPRLECHQARDDGSLRRSAACMVARRRPYRVRDGSFHDRRQSAERGRLSPRALYDVASGRIEPLSTFAQGKNISPQWSPDSRRLFFVSGRHGISNVYVVDISTGSIAQVTNIDSGVTGITALSRPSRRRWTQGCWPSARRGRQPSHLRHRYRGAACRWSCRRRRAAAGCVAAAGGAESMVAELLNDPKTGLAQSTDVEPYRRASH
jgi:hypothetical protein